MVAERMFEAHGIKPRIAMELGSDEAITVAVRKGLGVAILSQHSLALDGQAPGITQLDVSDFPVELQWHLIYPACRQLSRIAQAFLEFSRDHAADIVGSTRPTPVLPAVSTAVARALP
jgi:DNA-binding transcriptional LysR family regulator